MPNQIGKLNLIGIGGTGMLPLALLLQEAGYWIQGMDSKLTEANHALLIKNGIKIVNQEVSSNLDGIDTVVISPAVPRHNPVLRAAHRAGLEVISRSQALTSLLKGRNSICVTGSHGKSTTTAMLIEIMSSAQLPFGYMLGATYASKPSAHLGTKNSPFVLEACEAHGSLYDWCPTHAIVTNLDDEHASHYGGKKSLQQAFADFLSRVPQNGSIVICGDDANSHALAKLHPTCVTYGFRSHNRMHAITLDNGNTALYFDGQNLGELSLSIPGNHNILNAMAAISMATQLGIHASNILTALNQFKGVDRRLQFVGSTDGIHIFDDFAHHPTEIQASLSALKGMQVGRLIAVLQPQLHSRVQQLAPAFAKALSLADRCLVLPVEGLGETSRALDSDRLLAKVSQEVGIEIEQVTSTQDLLDALTSDLRFDDHIVIMAGRSGDDIASKVYRECLKISHQSARSQSILYGRQTDEAKNLPRLVRDKAISSPNSIAVSMGDRDLSYSMLMSRSQDLAKMLHQKGVKAQQPVAVCMGRSIDRVVAFLAILRIGAVYLPLDPTQPIARLELMLRDSRANTVIVNSASPALPELNLCFVNAGQILNRHSTLADYEIPDIFTDATQTEALAYIIYTSGTTGRPKGVEVTHASLANFTTAAIGHFGISSHARVSLVTGIGFDISVGDMAMALAAGACLVIPTDLQATPGRPLSRFVEDTQITHLSITPSLLSVISPGAYPKLTTIISVGENCPPTLVERWAKGRIFINAYGPTEATVEATFDICSTDHPITIGHPIDNMGACVLDHLLRIVPRGHEGELCLFGAGIARGYLNQPELTNERFVKIRLPDQSEQRIYRTGDRAKINATGHLICLGRMDDQLKFNGHRIEPAEVEAVLCRFHQIHDALVSMVNPHGDPQLVAHVVLRPEISVMDLPTLKMHLVDHLPTYMHPTLVLPLNELPRTINGKRDRSALPLPPTAFKPRPFRKPVTLTEKKLLSLVKGVTARAPNLGIRDSLTEMGFDSLALANLLLSIEAQFGITLDFSFETGGDSLEALGIAIDTQLIELSSTTTISHCKDNIGKLISRLRPHLASWPGNKKGKNGLLRHIGPETESAACETKSTSVGLFWCFQDGQEFAALSKTLDGNIQLFGFRSGHLAFEYSPDTLNDLAILYANEIENVCIFETIVLGGNCQGSLIATAVINELRRRGKTVCLSILMEQGRFTALSGEVLLLFGSRSYLNPYGQIDAPEKLFELAYPDGFRVAMLPGAHGQYFRPQNVTALSAIITEQINHVIMLRESVNS